MNRWSLNRSAFSSRETSYIIGTPNPESPQTVICTSGQTSRRRTAILGPGRYGAADLVQVKPKTSEVLGRNGHRVSAQPPPGAGLLATQCTDGDVCVDLVSVGSANRFGGD